MRNYFKVEPLRRMVFVPTAILDEEDESAPGGELVPQPRSVLEIMQRIHVFSDTSQVDAEQAWSHAAAQAAGVRERISIYRPIGLPGPWRWLSIVGLPASRMPMSSQRCAELVALARATFRQPVSETGAVGKKGELARTYEHEGVRERALQAVIDLEWNQAWKAAIG